MGIKNTYLAIKSSIENLTHQKLQSLGLNYVDKDNDGIDDRSEAFVDADGDGKTIEKNILNDTPNAILRIILPICHFLHSSV